MSILQLAAIGAVIALSPADDDSRDQEIAELKSLVGDLQKQVDQLKADDSDTWLTQERAAEIKGLVEEVLADADTRASLMQSGAVAGWDKGFFIASGDGNWLFRIGGQLQVRYTYNHRIDPPPFPPPADPGDEYRQGFEIRRAKLLLRGHVFNPTWQYDVQFAEDRNTGTVAVEDQAWLMKDFENGFKIKAGQTKAPYMLEEIISSQRMFAVERSLLNSFFTDGTVQGVNFIYDQDRWRLQGMYYDGNRSANTGWQVPDTEWGAVASRVEFLVIGDDWKRFVDYEGWRGEGTAVMLGAAVSYQKNEFGTTAIADEVGNLGFTTDVTAKFDGWSASGAFVYRNLDPNSPALATADQFGFYVQGGVFVADTVEIYARYEWADADTIGIPDMSVGTIGVSKYFDKHNLKWQTDFGYGFNAVDAVFANSNAGWLPDTPTEEGQFVIRSQFQLLF